MKKVVLRSTLALLFAGLLFILAGLAESPAGAQPNPCPGCPPCTNCPPVTNNPTRPYSVPGLKLTIPMLTNGNMLTTVFESDTNSAYDIFRRLVLQTNAPWFRAASGEIGQTNFTVPIPATNSAFLIAAEYLDSDFDGLPDAYETLVLHTNPLLADTDGDGVPDGDEDADLNGIPDRADYSGLTRAVIYTVDSTAAEGGGGGEFNLLLPFPAPTNGTTILLNLGGTAGYESDYLLSTFFGYITNEVVFGAGEYLKRIFVTAVDDAVQQTRPRTVQVALLSSANYALDPTPANVSLIDNDLPVVAIFNEDPIAGEQTNALGVITNKGAFHFRRYGDTTLPLTLWFNVSGSAQNGVDYPGTGPVITIAAESDRYTLELTPIQDNVFEGDEDVILTMIPSPFQEYTIHPLHTSARVVIKDDDLPALTVTTVDGTAAEYGSDTGLIRFQRNGSLAQPLTLDLAIAGSAKNGVDYAAISNTLTFAANVSQLDLPIQPLTDGVEETVETVIVTVRGSAKFTFNGTNAATVLIDDSSNTRFVVTPRKPTSVYCPFPVIESPAVFDIERRGRSAGSTNLPFNVYTNTESGLQVTAYFRTTGDVSGQSVAFAPYASRARVNFTIPAPRRLLPAASVLLQVPAVDSTTHEIRYLPEWQFVRLEILATNAIEGTSTNARLRLSRLVADAAVSVTFTLGGSAAGPGDPLTVDYNFTSPFTMTIPANSLSTETNIAALADGYLEGWESIFVTPDFTATDVSLDYQLPAVLFIREDTADPGSLPGSDFDLDGLPDYWEVANGLDPFTPGQADLDADGDGLTNLEEFQFGTSARAVDTDANGVNDFRQNVLGADPGPDYVPVRLYTKDTGKVNNGMNCAVCHTTQLKVGDYSLYSMRSANQEPAEKTYWYRKGQSYPIFLREIVATLPPTTNTSGNPTTTALYTAGILPGTNVPQAFVVQDPANKLGTNRPWSNFPSNTLTQIGTLVVPIIELTWETFPDN
ncbi:MAG TPA: Calx-beta domain-containing protein, partial [Verrucomicrobiae bacterium]|nr:Calx-beta domain-containing protein [Verrucomicrobiae bacterium]